MDLSDIGMIILTMIGVAALVVVLFLLAIGCINLMFGVLDYFEFTYDRYLTGSLCIGALFLCPSVVAWKNKD